MERKLPNLELVLYKAQRELACNEKWKDIITEKKEKNRYTYPNFVAEVFLQMWGTTCTGFDITQDGSPTIGGQAMTEEYTTVIHERTADFYCVFFGERLCYVISDASEDFMSDLKNHSMASLSIARKKY